MNILEFDDSAPVSGAVRVAEIETHDGAQYLSLSWRGEDNKKLARIEMPEHWFKGVSKPMLLAAGFELVGW